jgi:hypothetical protein
MHIRINLVIPSVSFTSTDRDSGFLLYLVWLGVRIGYRVKQTYTYHIAQSHYFGSGLDFRRPAQWHSAQPSIRRCHYSLLHFTAEVCVLFPTALLRYTA